MGACGRTVFPKQKGKAFPSQIITGSSYTTATSIKFASLFETSQTCLHMCSLPKFVPPENALKLILHWLHICRYLLTTWWPGKAPYAFLHGDPSVCYYSVLQSKILLVLQNSKNSRSWKSYWTTSHIRPGPNKNYSYYYFPIILLW